MTVTLYRSTDTGAPTLSGTAGSLVALLDAILVNGYNTNNPAGAGWTIAFTATNQRTYQQGASSNGYYLHVNDAAPITAKEARMFGSELASAVLTGTYLFPTTTQLANGVFARKSNTADATTRAWVAIADSRTLYLFVLTGDTASVYLGWAFGDYYSYLTGDQGNTFITARDTENSAATASTTERMDNMVEQIGGTLSGGFFIARDVTNARNTACAGSQLGDTALTANGLALQGHVGTLTYTNPADSLLYLAPVYVVSQVNGNAVRGRMRGFWHFCHAISNATDGDTFSGTGALSTKTFRIVKQGGNSGVFTLETSNTWDSN